MTVHPTPTLTSFASTLPLQGRVAASTRKEPHDTAAFAQINFDPNSEALEDDDEVFHEYLKTLPKAEAQAQFQARVTRQHEQQRRLVNNIFQFWIVCENGACKRIEACASNPHECFMRWWQWVPERRRTTALTCMRAPRAAPGARSTRYDGTSRRRRPCPE